MSRNLSRTDCYCCSGDIVHDEEPRPITEEECHPYTHYVADLLIVANAHCADCEARYLAWFAIDNRATVQHPYIRRTMSYEGGRPVHCDLSFRAAFNDEPADDDLPKVSAIEVTLRRALDAGSRWGGFRYFQPYTSEALIRAAETLMDEAVKLRAKESL